MIEEGYDPATMQYIVWCTVCQTNVATMTSDYMRTAPAGTVLSVVMNARRNHRCRSFGTPG